MLLTTHLSSPIKFYVLMVCVCVCDMCAGARTGEEGEGAPVMEVIVMNCLGAGNRTQVL